MKRMRKTGTRIFLFVLIACFSHSSYSQNAQQSSPMKNMISAKHFTFQAQSASPQGRGTKQLTYGYRVEVSGDTVDCYLPYFGKSYTPAIGTTQSPLTFTSYGSEYAVNDSKNGWDVKINLKDQSNAKTLSFTVFDDGTASLQVTSNNLQSISFRGYIDMKNKK
jgi:uncharacterized protein YcfL